MKVRRIIAVVAIAALTASPVPSMATSCINSKTVAIQFTRGSTCWTYYGDGTHFTGRFKAGQKVIATSSGIAGSAAASSEWRAVLPRIVSVSDRNGFFVELRQLAWTPTPLPRTGQYTFGFSPCSMWRRTGMFVICTQ
jgi:hypothetical protein